ncbi:hypothetical protein BFS30_01380 [Pedobacter steynii]|uniref:Uncharacterized protein n=2 Tax=Pedobacter steynii TaxID=430522 RepID=A0A1D7QBH2_9SPHI|nr:hypothetical protein BFS30_01380 [Pedobacter steynii]
MTATETPMNKIILSAFLLLLTFNCIAQKDAGIKALLSKNGELSLPVQVKTLNKELKVKPVVTSDDTYGDEYTWNTPEGLSFSGLVSADKTSSVIFLKAAKGKVLGGLPYGLTLNGSTLKDCESKFKTNILEKQKLNPVDNPGETSSFILKVKKGIYYIHLAFDAQLKLEQITLATVNLDAAG